MKLALSSSAPKADVLVFSLFKDESLSSTQKKLLGTVLTKQFEARVKAKDFGGEEGQSLTLYPEKGFKKVVVLGRGEEDKQMPKAIETLGGRMAAHSKGVKSIAVLVTDDEFGRIGAGFILGQYEFSAYKKQDKKAVKLGTLTFICGNNKKNKETLNKLKIWVEVSALTRDLVNTPAGDLTTVDMATTAKRIGKKFGMKVTVFDDKKLRKLGCGSITGVGQGAEKKSRMVFIEYKKGTRSKQPNIAFLGKGVVFDTGGLNLKPTGYIETMKQDMAGAATVLGTMQAIAQAKLKGYFLGVLCCAENAVSDRAIRPGDVLKAYNGKTIEVTNTDAEGRLCLADGLSYTEKNYKPKAMVNIATLTGAVSHALGNHITGVMGNDQAFINEVLETAEQMDERMWQLPLGPDFVKSTKGEFTDVKNSTSGVRAGATMGGAFLQNFVDKVPWVHFDIGGTAWTDKPTPTTKYGATAVAIRTFFGLAEKHQG